MKVTIKQEQSKPEVWTLPRVSKLRDTGARNNKRTIRNWMLLAALPALLLAACSKDDAPTTDTPVRIRTTIAPTYTPQTRVAWNPGDDGSGAFTQGDEIYLGILDAQGKIAGRAYTIGKTTLYWEDLGSLANYPPYTFYAYYPEDATTGNSFNAATATNPDMLVATPVAGINKGDDVDLVFFHAMHKLVVNLSTSVPGWDTKDARVTLLNMNAKVMVNVADAIVTPGDANNEKGNYPPRTGATTTHILAPQHLATGTPWIQIELGGKLFTYAVPATLDGGTPLTTLESGKMLTLNLNLTTDDVSLTTGEISGWTGGESVTDDVEIGTSVTVDTWAGLKAALERNEGTAEKPLVIILSADIATPEGSASPNIIVQGHKVVDGSGSYRLTMKQGNPDLISSLFSDNSRHQSSLTIRRVTLVHEYKELPLVVFSWGGHFVAGPGVQVTSTGVNGASSLFQITGDSRMTVDGASFTSLAGADPDYPWISYGSSTSTTTGNITLKDFSFAGADNYIYLYHPTNNLQLNPGRQTVLPVCIYTRAAEKFVISPLTGTFSETDVTKLRLMDSSSIEGQTTDNYEFYLHTASGTIRLRAKAQNP
ncbi:fimbrillin family protein [Phocaeicola sp.]